jgi:catechol 2,3-dioxygenase-like lactoylglutathione lyase family enzyme
MLAEPMHSYEKTLGTLSGARVAYLILYVRDLEESRNFYERQLGLRALEDDEDSVKLDVGLILLWLQRASDYGIPLAGRHDDSSDLVFLVEDVNSMRQILEARGVTFVRRRTYEIGLVTDFYDPNGHRLMLYQPSAKALSWPSGAKLRQVWAACGKGKTDLIGPPAVRGEAAGLEGQPLVYLFLFVPNSDEALAFYQRTLGLEDVERVHCCNPACPPEEKGIVKYDVGGLLLTTHHVHRSPVVDDFGRVYSPKGVDPAHTKGVAPVFLTRNLPAVVERLSLRGVKCRAGIIRSHIGHVACIEADTGHAFYLYEPEPAALQWPSGVKVRQIQDL